TMYIGRRTRNCARISLESLTPVSLLWLPDAPGVRGRRLALRSCLSLESLAPVSVRWLQENLGKHRCQCGCGQVVDLQARHYRHGVPRFIHGHHNRRGHWLVHQLREAGYLTVSDVAKALGIGTTSLRRREGTLYPRAARVGGSGSITRRTSSCSDGGTRCRRWELAGNSAGPLRFDGDCWVRTLDPLVKGSP